MLARIWCLCLHHNVLFVSNHRQSKRIGFVDVSGSVSVLVFVLVKWELSILSSIHFYGLSRNAHLWINANEYPVFGTKNKELRMTNAKKNHWTLWRVKEKDRDRERRTHTHISLNDVDNNTTNQRRFTCMFWNHKICVNPIYGFLRAPRAKWKTA